MRSTLAPALLLFFAACTPAASQPVVELGAAPPASAQPPAPPLPAPRAVAPSKVASLDAVREHRPEVREARSMDEAEVDLARLTSLLGSAPPGTPERAALLRHVGDVASEAAAAAAAEGKAARATSAHREAMRAYQQLSRESPAFCAPAKAGRPPGLDCGDAVLYALGLEAERAKDLDTARRSYLELIQRYPQSRWIAPAYVAFGEMFFRESEVDPSKTMLAEQSYREALKYPPPENVVFGYAHLQLGRVLRKKGEPEQAARPLQKAVAWAEQYPHALAAAEIGAAAKAELAELRR
jgi:TolA-binding protein